MANIMQKFNNSKVKEKLSTMTRSMIIMLFGLGLTAVIGAFELNTQTKTLANEWMVANNLIADIDYYTSVPSPWAFLIIRSLQNWAAIIKSPTLPPLFFGMTFPASSGPSPWETCSAWETAQGAS